MMYSQNKRTEKIYLLLLLRKVKKSLRKMGIISSSLGIMMEDIQRGIILIKIKPKRM